MATKAKKKKSAGKRPVAKKKSAPSKKKAKMKVAAKKMTVAKKKSPQAAKAKTAATKSPRPKLSAHEFSAKMLTPLEDRIVVRVALAAETTSGGIIIPGTVSPQPDRGEIMAAGPGRRDKKGRLRPLDVEVGDTVLFPQYTGTRISILGEDFLIMREDEILGIVET